MKGIVLAGGLGSRLFPMTLVTSKQLLPVYDKPMVFYPISTLMLAGIKDILIISTPNDIKNFKKLLGTGRSLGLKLSYQIQDNPDGLAQAFILGEKFLNHEAGALILGDNVFYGECLEKKLICAIRNAQIYNRATVFGYKVNNPQRFGVIEFGKNQQVIGIEEKPSKPKSSYAVTGLYFYPSDVCQKAKQLRPSKRNELEITDLNELYLKEGRLDVKLLGRGYSWLDTGTVDSLVDASVFVKSIEKKKGKKIAVLEEIAYRNGWISKEQFIEAIKCYGNCPYGIYLNSIADNRFSK